jgi:ribosome recycling factor
MNETFFSDLQNEFDKTITAFRRDLSKVRTGRASTALLEGIMVDYYGTPTPLNQLGNLTVPEPRLLVIQAYDPTAMSNIEKAILKGDLGLTPNNDGKVIRIPIPELNEERRRELVKHVKKVAEEFRVSVRNHRRVNIDKLKEMQKGKEITEDDFKQCQERIQKMTDEFIGRVDKVLKTKDEEIMEV